MTGFESGNGHRNLSVEGEVDLGMTLQPWQEVVGVLEGAFIEGSFFIMKLRIGGRPFSLSFDPDSPESERIRTALKDISIGAKVGMIMTDSMTEPFLFRKIRE
ncbi:MAG: hypothetical protein V3U09_03660 [Thermoplasmata archaeon]